MTSLALLAVLCFSFSFLSIVQARKRILVLGGDGMLGSETVARLKLRGHDITVLHRGNWYWDSSTRIKPWVNFVRCDRDSFNECVVQLVDITKEKGLFDAVIDFSGYKPGQVKDFMKKMRNKIRRYIYVSTDSVYEVCKEPSHEGPILEEDAVRPEDPREREEYAKRDLYGNNKLECEEAVKRENELWDIPYIIIRLPDVIGLRDNTNRFWNYILWLRFHDIFDRPLDVPPTLHDKPLSFVFAEDVANLLIVLPEHGDDKLYNFVYNLAFRETVSLEQLLRIMAKHLGISEVKVDRSKEDGVHYFPSVTRGPVDTNMALHYLGWNPHSLDVGVRKTVQFYEYAMRSSDFKAQRKAILDKFYVPTHALGAFKQRLKDIYGIDYDRAILKDEL